jgi:hypothetical protein
MQSSETQTVKSSFVGAKPRLRSMAGATTSNEKTVPMTKRREIAAELSQQPWKLFQ